MQYAMYAMYAMFVMFVMYACVLRMYVCMCVWAQAEPADDAVDAEFEEVKDEDKK